MTASEIDALFDDVRRYLPPYLSADDKRELFLELRRLREEAQGLNYFWANPSETEVLQGDVWRPLLIRRFEDGVERSVTGIIVSNSCDIAPENDPDPNQNVLFAPLQQLAAYRQALIDRGKTEEQADTILNDIRKQLRTDVFFLPALGGLPECIVALDDLHAHPLSDFLGRRQQRLAVLSQVGHYIFLIKLSLHFTRLQEGVRRKPA